METLQDVREARAHWNRVFCGKREPVKLRIGRHTIFSELCKRTVQKITSIIRRTTTAPPVPTIPLQRDRAVQRDLRKGV